MYMKENYYIYSNRSVLLNYTKIKKKTITDTFQGPQINKAQFDKILNYVKIGQEEGATLYKGGKRWGDKGYFIEPTIFTNCKNSMRIMQEEVFGPFVGIATFETIDEAIAMANDSTYGLAGGVYTSSVDAAIRVSNEIKAGTVWVSCLIYL